jgi:hypothetical protein
MISRTLFPPQDPTFAHRTLARLVAGSMVGWSLAAAWVTWLTLRLNPQLHGHPADRFSLMLLVVAGYLVVGAAVAAALAVPTVALARRAPRVAAALAASAAALPLVFALALPDSGLTPTLLPNLATAGLGLRALQPLAILGGATLVLTGVLTISLDALTRWSRWAPTILAAAAIVAAAGLVGWWPLPGESGAGPDTVSLGADDAGATPAPLVLLCVDGADLDDVVLPMVAAGELPTFAELLENGVWGPLASLDPGLSAVIWTTLVTGVGPEEHGIHHFVHVELPRMRLGVRVFPLMTGLNFHLLAAAERIPGMPPLRHPYTSDMRRRPALWELVGPARTVGIYRWLITWPVEPVNGFNIGESVVVDLGEPGLLDLATSNRTYHPPGVEELIGALPPRAASDADVAAYLGRWTPEIAADSRLAEVRQAIGEPTLQRLIALRERFRPDLTLASFFSVDSFNHLFARERGSNDRPFSGAVAARYRQLDRALGELVATFDQPTNLVVVSDHGYDYAADHHTHGPPGLFVAAGPAFRRGLRVDGLSVFDITPLALRVLGAPLVQDLPGTRSGAYQAVLDPEFAATVPERRSPGPTRRHAAGSAARDELVDDRVIEQLRRLGYLEE